MRNPDGLSHDVAAGSAGIPVLFHRQRQEKLTVLITCKNESLNIASCIESVRPIADEILVADSGSTDGTLAIVQRAGGCRIIQRDWNGYAAFKNWAIPQAKHPWVLIVDADERVTPELAAEIRQTLTNPPAHIDAYRIRHRTFFLGYEIKHCGRNTNSACRLIRRDVCRYRDVRVHEEIDIGRRRVKRLKHKFLHYEYRSYEHYFAKRLRYAKRGAEEKWAKGQRAGVARLLLRPFLRFFQLYFLRLGFLDGLPGIQLCMLMAFCNTFMKQAHLWEMQYAKPQEAVERMMGTYSPQSGGTDSPKNPLPQTSRMPASDPDLRSKREPLPRVA
jgi:glycosyltransferase involved in cell wall biosynthesis